MVATQAEGSCVQLLQQQSDLQISDQIEEDEDFLMTDTNRVLLDANQMLIDLKNEIDNKNLLINKNSLLLEELKGEVTKKTQSLEQLKKGHKEVLFEKDKLVKKIGGNLRGKMWIKSWNSFQIIDLENSIRNHNNRIEDLEVEKLHLENEVVELKRAVQENPISDQLQAVTTHKNQLEIEVKTRI